MTERKDALNFPERLLLICGILASLLYVATDILAAMQYPGYSYTSQSISQLLAIGAPTRAFIVVPMAVYNVLMLAFAIGVWGSAGQKGGLRVTGMLLGAYAIASAAGLFLTPLHLGEAAEPSATAAIVHIIATGVLVLSMLLYMGFGAAAHGKGFRLYTIATILIMLVFVALTSLLASHMNAQLATPWMGVTERVNVYASMLWVLVFAVVRLRALGQELQGSINPGRERATPADEKGRAA